MFGNLGMWEVLILLFIVLLLFGAKRLPEIGGSLGKGIREFKGSLKEVEGEFREIGNSDSLSEAAKNEREKQEQNSV
ncbi:MAG: twin-arginine translocase TatA/TatE family subunit [Gemmatimonadota bacterium]|jgi:sec-independent protein translocase protein TatA